MTAAPTIIPLRHMLFGFAALALLMGSVDSTIAAVAVPTLGTTLHAPLTSVGWTLTAYLLVQIVKRLLRMATDIDVHVVADRSLDAQ